MIEEALSATQLDDLGERWRTELRAIETAQSDIRHATLALDCAQQRLDKVQRQIRDLVLKRGEQGVKAWAVSGGVVLAERTVNGGNPRFIPEGGL